MRTQPCEVWIRCEDVCCAGVLSGGSNGLYRTITGMISYRRRQPDYSCTSCNVSPKISNRNKTLLAVQNVLKKLPCFSFPIGNKTAKQRGSLIIICREKQERDGDGRRERIGKNKSSHWVKFQQMLLCESRNTDPKCKS